MDKVKQSYYKLLDTTFSLFVFSTIILANSNIGKISQLLFVFVSLYIPFVKKIRFPFYNTWLLLFVLYIFIQVVWGVARLECTLDMAFTMLFTSLFIMGMYNYVVYRNNLYRIAYIYAKSSVWALVLVVILYYNTLFTFRLNALANLSLAGILLGGSSATALAMCAVIPAFFITLFPPNGERRKAYPYLFFFGLIIILTGTRKVLIPFVYIVFFVNEQLKRNTNNKTLKIIIRMTVGTCILYLCVMNIPVLYNLLGYRIENALLFFELSESTDSSIVVRNRMIDNAIDLFNKRQWFGWGMDYFKGSDQSGLGYYSHNNYLEILSGGGIVGFVIYYFRYILLLTKQVKARLVCREEEKRILTSCIGFFIIMIVLEYWQITYFYRQLMIYQAILLGLLYVPNLQKKNV